MKTHINKTIIFALALVVAFTTAFGAPAFAANEDDRKADISFIETESEMPVCRLSFENEANEILFVSIADSDGTIIFREKVSGSKIVRNYQFNADQISGQELKFTIASVDGKTQSVYNVSKNKKNTSGLAVNHKQ